MTVKKATLSGESFDKAIETALRNSSPLETERILEELDLSDTNEKKALSEREIVLGIATVMETIGANMDRKIEFLKEITKKSTVVRNAIKVLTNQGEIEAETDKRGNIVEAELKKDCDNPDITDIRDAIYWRVMVEKVERAAQTRKMIISVTERMGAIADGRKRRS